MGARNTSKRGFGVIISARYSSSGIISVTRNSLRRHISARCEIARARSSAMYGVISVPENGVFTLPRFLDVNTCHRATSGSISFFLRRLHPKQWLSFLHFSKTSVVDHGGVFENTCDGVDAGDSYDSDSKSDS